MTSTRGFVLLLALPAWVLGCGSATDFDDGTSGSIGGFASNTGGNGETASGGNSTSLGGAIAFTGGRSSTGGAATGGKHATGGRPATGGAKTTGGATSGGASGMHTGGTTLKSTTGGTFSGGKSGTGGASTAVTGVTGGSGGAVNGGSSAKGGTANTGGSGGISAGGLSAIGGTSSLATGGLSSTGGSSTCPSYVLASEELIDDMDDGNAAIPAVNGRRGAWSDGLINASGATMSPNPSSAFFMTDTGDVCRKYAVYVHGQTSVDASSGANFGFSLGSPYDASAYTGISFWAKIDAGTNPPVRVGFPDKDTDPRGAVCQTTSGALQCWNHFGYRLTLTTTWTKYTLAFAQLTQDPWGYRATAFDPATLFEVQFQVGENDTFGIWVDSVAFTK